MQKQKFRKGFINGHQSIIARSVQCSLSYLVEVLYCRNIRHSVLLFLSPSPEEPPKYCTSASSVLPLTLVSHIFSLWKFVNLVVSCSQEQRRILLMLSAAAAAMQSLTTGFIFQFIAPGPSRLQQMWWCVMTDECWTSSACRGVTFVEVYRSKLKPALYCIEQIWNTTHRRTQPQQKMYFAYFQLNQLSILVSRMAPLLSKNCFGTVYKVLTHVCCPFSPSLPLWRAKNKLTT